MSLRPVIKLGQSLAKPLELLGKKPTEPREKAPKDVKRRYWDAGVVFDGLGGDKPTDEQYRIAGEAAKVPWTAIKAIWQIESRQIALMNGRPLIRIEPGKWATYGGRKSDLPKPLNPGGETRAEMEKGQALRWINFDKLFQIDPVRAIASTSWGGGQTMGYWAGLCGFNSEKAFYEAQLMGAGAQLLTTANFIAAKDNAPLQRALVKGDAHTIAFHYNGPGYRANRYDEKYLAALRRFA